MSPRLFTTLALAASLASGVAATTTKVTEPVGFMRYTAGTGLQTIGFPLLNAPVAAGIVAATDAGALRVADGLSTLALSSQLDADRAYYLEFTAGPDGDTTFVGDRIELAVAATVAATNPGNTIRLQLDSSHSTLRSLPADLAGYRFVIRAHVTLASAFGTGSDTTLQAGTNTANADQVHFLRDGAYQTYLFRADASTGQRSWVKFPEGTPADRQPIAPGTGMFFRRVGADAVDFRHMGSVRTHAFVQPLAAGYSLVSEAFPVATSFADRGMTDANGFVPGTTLDNADSVFVWDGAGYRTLFYATNSGTAPSWRDVAATAEANDQGLSSTFSPFTAVLIQKHVADPAYVVPSPL